MIEFFIPKNNLFVVLLLFILVVNIVLPVYVARATIPVSVLLSLQIPYDIAIQISAASTEISVALSAAYDAVIKTSTSLLVKKEYILDPLANLVAQTIIRAITQQIIGWVQGKDAGFVQNLEQEFRRSVDERAGEFLNNLTGLNLCGNFAAYLNITLRTPGLRQRIQCTLTDIINNVNSFYANFQQGGWPAFIRLSFEPQNTVQGAYLIALDAKIEAENRARERVGAGFAVGQGFLGFKVPVEKDCIFTSGNPTGEKEEEKEEGEGGAQGPGTVTTVILPPGEVGSQPPKKICRTEYETKTPGNIIAEGLKKSVYSGLDSALLADEINEAIAAIVTALLNKVIAASSGGGQGIFDKNVANTPDPNASAPGFDFIINQLDDAIARAQKAQTIVIAQITAPPGTPPPPPPGCADPCSSLPVTSKEELAARFNKLNVIIGKLAELRNKIANSTNSTSSPNTNEIDELLTEAELAIQKATGMVISGGAKENFDENTLLFAANAKSLASGAIAYIDQKIGTSTTPTGNLPALKTELQTEIGKLDQLVAEFKTAIDCKPSGCPSKLPIANKILQEIMVINAKVLEVYKL